MTVINRLLISVLPLELAQDVYTYSGSDHERAKMAGALLTGYFVPLFSIDILETGILGKHYSLPVGPLSKSLILISYPRRFFS